MMPRWLGAFFVVATLLCCWSLSLAMAQLSDQDLITGIEREIIERYFKGDDAKDPQAGGKKNHKANGGKALPPGLAKRDSLPPGLQKQLTERGTLPPGLAKRDLPDNLRSQLPYRPGEKFYIVDDNVLLVQQATGLVLDVIEGALGGR